MVERKVRTFLRMGQEHHNDQHDERVVGVVYSFPFRLVDLGVDEVMGLNQRLNQPTTCKAVHLHGCDGYLWSSGQLLREERRHCTL